MKKHFLSFLALVLSAHLMWAASITAPADIPDYWSSINGLSGENLFNQVSKATAVGYSSLGYGGLWDAYAKTDVYPTDSTGKAGKIWDMYSACLFAVSNHGSYSKECDKYNREHSVPQSWWGSGTSNQGCDIFHVLPTDGYVNNWRGNDPYGEVTSANKTSTNGCKSGSSKLSGYSGTVFEPADQYKGDIARGILGAMTKWKGNWTQGQGGSTFNGTYTAAKHFGLTDYAVDLFLRWHRNDPVSQKEIDRNNGIQATQGNRNPFIDYPYLVEYIWGEHAGETIDMSKLIPSTDPAFVPGKSNGWKDGTTPDPGPGPDPENYTATWIADGTELTTTTAQSGKSPAMPTANPADCDEYRVFRGWTTNSTYSGDGSDLFTTSAPAITSDIAFYAVYADKETSAGSSSASTAEFLPANFSGQGTSGTGSAISTTVNGVTFACDKGFGGGEIRCYSGGTVTISSDYTITAIAFSFSGSSYKGGLESSYSNLSTTSWSKKLDSQARFSKIVVTISGGGSSTTYKNFSTECSQTEKVTITFHKNDGSDVTSTQKVPVGTNTALTANTWTHKHFSFQGWSLSANGAKIYDDKQIINFTANTDLYAVWEQEEQYTVTCYNGSKIFDTATGYAGDGLLIVDPSVCETYQFAGWCTESYMSEVTIKPETATLSIIPVGGATYHALFSRTETSGTSSTLSTDSLVMEDYKVVSGKFGDYTFTASKGDGTATPTFNTTGKDARVYAKGTLKIESSTAMTKIVFYLSDQGKKKLAAITASTGAIATQASTDEVVTWTGNATSVTFTVGDKAIYGNTTSDAGQLCYLSVAITSGTAPTTTTYYTSYPNCPVEQYTVTWDINGETVPVDFEEGDDLYISPSLSYFTSVPCANGKIFVGWTEDDPEEYFTEASGEVTADITYYAVYATYGHTDYSVGCGPASPTSIDNTNAAQQWQKIIVNGQLYIRHGEQNYSIIGQMIQ